MRIKAGIFFGGASRERESSYAAARSLLHALDKTLFDPVPVFVDKDLNLAVLEPSGLYKDGFRQFFPSFPSLPPSPHAFHIYQESLGPLSAQAHQALLEQVGRPLAPEALPEQIQVAFIVAPQGSKVEKSLQAILTEQSIPYTGNASATIYNAADRTLQRAQLNRAGIPTPRFLTLDRRQWLEADRATYFREVRQYLGTPFLTRPAHLRPGPGLSFLDGHSGQEVFEECVEGAFFRETLSAGRWKDTSKYDKIDHLRLLTDLRDGLGFPVDLLSGNEKTTVYHPEALLRQLDEVSATAPPQHPLTVESHYKETEVLIEEHHSGWPFSCIIVCEEAGKPRALHPTTNRLREALPGTGRPDQVKTLRTDCPDLPGPQVAEIRRLCVEAFEAVESCRVFARIDGLLTEEGRVLISEVDPEPALTPEGAFFRQMAFLGLHPSAALTYLLEISLRERISELREADRPHHQLDQLFEQIRTHKSPSGKKRVGILVGGTPFRRRASFAGGRLLFEMLSGSAHYDPVPVLCSPSPEGYRLYQLPEYLLYQPVSTAFQPPAVRRPLERASALLRKDFPHLAGSGTTDLQPIEWVNIKKAFDLLFLNFNDPGLLQEQLEAIGMPFTGAGAAAMRTLDNRYLALRTLQRNGLPVPRHRLLRREAYEEDPETFLDHIEEQFTYPFFVLPPSVRCSAAERKLNSRQELAAYCRLLFRPDGHKGLDARYLLRLRPEEAFPRSEELLVRENLPARKAKAFIEFAGTVFTSLPKDADRPTYSVLTPSEILDKDEILTIQEQYRSVEKHYITPARWNSQPEAEKQVRQQLEKAARILRLEGVAMMEGKVRLYDDQKVTTIITDIDPFPPLKAEGVLFQQVIKEGQTPTEFIDNLLRFASRRELLRKTSADRPSASAAGAETGFSAGGAKTTITNTNAMSLHQSSGLGKTIVDWFKKTGSQIWEFLTSPIFLKNFGLLLLFLVGGFLLINYLLNVYTHHGESLQVQNYVDMQLEVAKQKANSRSFEIVVNDSVYRENIDPNTVLEQTPQPFSRVKENRRIYVVISRSTAPEVLLPKLAGAYNFNTYRRKLLQRGLKAEVRERQFDNKLEENTILYFFYDGRRITENDLDQGIKVPKGSTLEFVVTERLTDQVPAPDLICKRYSAASFQLTANELVVGEIYGNFDNQEEAFVYDQEPSPGQMMQKGEQVNLFLTSNRPEGCTGEEGDLEGLQENQFGDEVRQQQDTLQEER